MPPLQNKMADKTIADMKVLRKIELKNLADWFLKSPSEAKSEQEPIYQATKQYNGITLSKMNGEQKTRRVSDEKSTTESGEDLGKAPGMSILRKLCFFLSLNGGVLYVAAFLWFIPCRSQNCLQPQKDWTMSIGGQLTSNMEASPSLGHPQHVMFGYSDKNFSNLASIEISSGKMKWNTRTNHILRHVFCNYDHLLNEKDGIPKCVLTAYNYIAAFDDTNGNILWERNITDPEGEIIHKLSLAGKPETGLYFLGVGDLFLFVVDPRNGSLVTTLNLPCSWPIDIKLVEPLVNNSGWILVCENQDDIEVWAFEEKELLKPTLQENSPEKNGSLNPEKFSLLFRRAKSSDGAIDLGSDVTKTSDSLVLSWANVVAMVTNQAPPAWERRSWNTSADSAVTSILSGNFTDPNAIEIAVAVQDGENATIHILNAKTGSSVKKTELGARSVMSMEKIRNQRGDADMIIIESVHQVRSNSTDSKASPQTRAYFTMQYNKNDVIYQNIATTEVFESILIPYTSGAATLLIASQKPEGSTVLYRYVVTSQQQETTCHWGTHHNMTTVLLLD